MPDIYAIGGMLTNLGVNHRFDDDGDITFSMRLPGRMVRTSDGTPDWEPLQYTLQPDFSVVGEFTVQEECTDVAKRVVRIYLMGSRLSSGILQFQAFPKVVPSKFEGTGHIAVVAPVAEAYAFNRQGSGLRATRFRNGSFGVAGAAEGRVTEEALRVIIDTLNRSAGQFMQTRFSGAMATGPA